MNREPQVAIVARHETTLFLEIDAGAAKPVPDLLHDLRVTESGP